MSSQGRKEEILGYLLRDGLLSLIVPYKREEKESGSLLAMVCTLLEGNVCLKESMIWQTSGPSEKL